MTGAKISPDDPYPRQRAAVLDTEIAYVDTGKGRPVVFLHGNPTSSYLWRNVLPHAETMGRCLAPDLVGMGQSGPAPDGGYRFADHVRYMDAWFDALDIHNAILVGHDWGSAIAFHWAARNPGRVAGLVYMEAIVRPRRWDEFPSGRDKLFRQLRAPEGEDLVLKENFFVEEILPRSVLRDLRKEELDAYRAPFPDAESRLPTLVWPRELPIEGEPADVTATVEEYGEYLQTSQMPKLFLRADPGAIIVGETVGFCRSFPNQVEIAVPGIHYVQEDSPHEIGRAIANFVAEI